MPTRGAGGGTVAFTRLVVVTAVEFTEMLAVTVPSTRVDRLALTTSCPNASRVPVVVTVWVPSEYVTVAGEPGVPVIMVGAAVAVDASTVGSTWPPTGAAAATAGGSMNASVP